MGARSSSKGVEEGGEKRSESALCLEDTPAAHGAGVGMELGLKTAGTAVVVVLVVVRNVG